MRCSVVLAALVAWLLPGACATSPTTHGPIPARNQHPAQLTLLDLDSVAGFAVPAGAVRARGTLAYTSLFLSGAKPDNAFVMDGELLRTGVSLQVGITDQLSLAAEVPFVHTTGGFLDSFLIAYHDLFGLPDQDRDLAPKNRFDVQATHQGVTAFEMEEDAFDLADLPLAASWLLQRPGPGSLGVALRFGVELPTGDDSIGVGNGEVDFGLGLAAELPLSGCSLHGHLQHTFAGTPASANQAGIEFADVTAVGAGVAVPLVDDLQAVVQLRWENSTLREIELPETESWQLLLWFGGRLRLDGDLFLEFTLGEDLRSYASPDVTFWFSVAWLPGG